MRGVWVKADRFDWRAALIRRLPPPLSLIVRTPTAALPAIEAQPGVLSRAQPPKRSGHTLLHSFRSVGRRQQTSGPIFARCGLAATRAPESGRPDLLV